GRAYFDAGFLVRKDDQRPGFNTLFEEEERGIFLKKMGHQSSYLQKVFYESLIEAGMTDKATDTLDSSGMGTDYASWQQHIRLYFQGKYNRVNILKSIDEGPFQMGTFWEILTEGVEGAFHLGPERPRVYSNLSPKEKESYNANIRVTNILIQGLPKDIYTLINHYTDARDIWDNVKMLLECSELTKEDMESQLYDDFKHFCQNKGETIHDYYAWNQATVQDDRVVVQNVQDNVFQTDDCDAFDFDVNEAPTAQTMFMANLASADPVYDEADSSCDSNILSEAKFKLTKREKKIDEQLRIVITDRNIKEENLKKELHSLKMKLSSTINHNKSMVEEVMLLKKDFKQKENKYLEEFLDMKALKEKVKNKLYKQDQSLQTVHMLCKPKSHYDEQNKTIKPSDGMMCQGVRKEIQTNSVIGDSIHFDTLAIGAIGPPRPFKDGWHSSSKVRRSGTGGSPFPSVAISNSFKRVGSARDLLWVRGDGSGGRWWRSGLVAVDCGGSSGMGAAVVVRGVGGGDVDAGSGCVVVVGSDGSIFSSCYLFRNSFSSTTTGDENHVRTLGDYSKPSHEGYRNTIELPVRNNVMPLRSDTIRLVQNGCSFHGLRSEDPNQHLKDLLNYYLASPPPASRPPPATMLPPPENFSGGLFPANPKRLPVFRSIRSTKSLPSTRRPTSSHTTTPPPPLPPSTPLPPPNTTPTIYTTTAARHPAVTVTPPHRRRHHHLQSPPPSSLFFFELGFI
nr:integrase, catalytic region, zinc finger, CCHC-type, peptidase aspartic, catalytic [Tanacetum cinerariifolium]